MEFVNHKLNIVPINVYIDPPYPVDKAIITHAHSDHARSGHKNVLATKQTIQLMKLRYGENCAESFQELQYGEKIKINDIEISLFPSGHILGSSQILLKKNGYKVLITGDYKTKKDPTVTEFELVKCNTLITEATFGLPIFCHPNPSIEVKKIINSLKQKNGKNHLLGAYALGKAQRLIKLIRESGYAEKIYIHGAMEKLCKYYEHQGIKLGKIEKINSKEKKPFTNKLILCPPSALRDRWSRKFNDCVISQASGWMCIKQRVKQNLIEIPLIISDHSDWNELTQTIKDTNAENIWITHGREDGLVRWCNINGLNAKPLSIIGRDEEVEQ